MQQKEVITILRKRRKTLGVTQKHLSELSGISLRTIRMIENDNGNPTIETLYRLADVLGMELKLEVKKVS